MAITLIVELACDHDGCDTAYAPAITELTSVQATLAGAARAGWTVRGQHLCPAHNGNAALIAMVTGLVAQGQTDGQIGDGLGWPFWQVQRFRSKYGIAPARMGRPVGSRSRKAGS